MGLFSIFSKKTDTPESSKSSRKDRFLYDMMHDRSTGLYNESGFQMLYQDADREHIGVIIISLTDYANMPAKMGEQEMQQLAAVITQRFRSVDHICRTGKNEITVIMARADSSMSELVVKKAQSIADAVKPLDIKAGIAFSDRKQPVGDVLEDAETALFRAKIPGEPASVLY